MGVNKRENEEWRAWEADSVKKRETIERGRRGIAEYRPSKSPTIYTLVIELTYNPGITRDKIRNIHYAIKLTN